MKELYPQESKEYRQQVNQKQFVNNKRFVICFRNIFDSHISKTKNSKVLAKENFFIPILEMETKKSYSDAIEILKESHFHKPFMGISNILSVRESIADISPHLSQIYVGGLIVDDKGNLLLVRSNGKYSIPNYKLTYSEAAYVSPVSELITKTAFENLDRDIDIYPASEGDNQSFDITSGIIINSNKGDFEYVNKVLFLVIYKVDDFKRLIVNHKEDGKEAVVLTLEEASSLVNHTEVSNPWLDYIITSLLV